ncbi:uncharacterized protein LOC134190685 isoform X2 [Corticium candelabrum]|uniref:uncharacterized protein LOC134190685 isoform X2 n=1 Tax=Corticium candelabrum TaxID=121492 RepID=UPI002E2665B2|nr:uncharacterized protein LOC134190685 isoform X2 [Corticium candelabrum]
MFLVSKEWSHTFLAWCSKPEDGPEPHYQGVAKGYERLHLTESFYCELGGILPEITLAYETYGNLSEDKSNAILLHAGLSASSHAKSHEKNPDLGWWEEFIGPGRALDTDKFFVICVNNLSGCYGSSGPSSINPLTGKHYGTTFPLVTVQDMVQSQFLVVSHFGIKRLHACVGASLGGMQSLLAPALFPERVGRVVSISACVRSHPSSIAVRYIQRRILMSDANWNNGHYYEGTFPHRGMRHARELGMIGYRSGPEWEERFGIERADPNEPHSFCPDFQIETYLEKKAEVFSNMYDPNSVLYISKAMDMFDMGFGYSSLQDGVARVKCPVLILGVQTDILFPVHQQQEAAELLRKSGNSQVVYYELNSKFGHDTFLLDVQNVGAAVKGHLENSIF